MTWESNNWEFATERLRVVGWRTRGDEALAAFLLSALTEDVTRELPPTWQQGVTPETVQSWIEARDANGHLFLVETRDTGAPVGLFVYSVDEEAEAGSEVRLGYVFAEHSWGRGYATELLQAFVQRVHARSPGVALLAGVTIDNRPSQRVLEKTGFVKTGECDGLFHYRRD